MPLPPRLAPPRLLLFLLTLLVAGASVVRTANVPSFVCNSNTTHSAGAPVTPNCNFLQLSTNTQRYFGRFADALPSAGPPAASSSSSSSSPTTSSSTVVLKRQTQIEIVFQGRTRLVGYRLGCVPDGHPLEWKVFDESGTLLDTRQATQMCDPHETFAVENAETKLPSLRFFLEVTKVALSINLPNPPVPHVLQLTHIGVDVDRHFGVATGPWAACSKECAGGTQTRDAHCANVFNGQQRAAEFCGFVNGDSQLEPYRSQTCNPQPCVCLGSCLDSARWCSTSGAATATLGCDKVFLRGSDSLVRMSWAGVVHTSASTVSSEGALDSLSVKPYYKSALLGGYSLGVASLSTLTPSAWRLFAGRPDFEEGGLAAAPSYHGLTLVDFRHDFKAANWAEVPLATAGTRRRLDGKITRTSSHSFGGRRLAAADAIHFATFDLNAGTDTKEKLQELLGRSYPAGVPQPAGLVVPETAEITDGARWGYYRIEFLTVGDGVAYATNQKLQANTFPAQVGLSDFDVFLRGVTFSVSLGAWSACTKFCGGGTQSRTVRCMGSDNGIYPFRVCPSYDPALHTTSKACNTDVCPPPGQISQVELQPKTRYDILSLKVSVGAPGGNLVCAAYAQNDDLLSFPPEAASPQTASIDMGSNLLRRQRVSTSCTPPACEVDLDQLPQNKTQRLYCGVEDISGQLHVQWQREEKTLRGPVPQKTVNEETGVVQGLGCYRDHIIRKDLGTRKNATGKVDGLGHNEGECAELCKDFHYFGLQGMGECRCGNNTERTYGVGRTASQMSGGCDCDGPMYGVNVQCVWEQVPPLIRHYSDTATRAWASKLQLGLVLDPDEFLFAGGHPHVVCSILAATNLQTRARTSALPDGTRSQKAQCFEANTNTPCLVEWKSVEPNTEYQFACQEEDSDLRHESRHVRYKQVTTPQTALVFEPEFGVTSIDHAWAKITVRNMDWRAVQYQCYAQDVEDSTSSTGSDRAWCPYQQDCEAVVFSLQHGRSYDIFCELQSGNVRTRIAPGQLPDETFKAKQYLTKDWYRDAYAMPGDGTSPAPVGAGGPASTSVREGRQPSDDAETVAGGFVAGMVGLGFFFTAVGWVFVSGCRGNFEELAFPEEANLRQKVAMCAFEFLQWYDFIADVVLTKNLCRIGGEHRGNFVAGVQHFAVVLLTWMCCVYAWSVFRLGVYPMFVDNYGGRRFYQYHNAHRRNKKGPECGAYLLFIFPVSIFAPLWLAGSSSTMGTTLSPGSAQNTEQTWRAFHGKRFFRNFLSILEDFGYLLLCLMLLMSSDSDLDLGREGAVLQGDDVAHSFTSSVLMLVYAHILLPVLLSGGMGTGAGATATFEGAIHQGAAGGLSLPRTITVLPGKGTGEGGLVDGERNAGYVEQLDSEDGDHAGDRNARVESQDLPASIAPQSIGIAKPRNKGREGIIASSRPAGGAISTVAAKTRARELLAQLRSRDGKSSGSLRAAATTSRDLRDVTFTSSSSSSSAEEQERAAALSSTEGAPREQIFMVKKNLQNRKSNLLKAPLPQHRGDGFSPVSPSGGEGGGSPTKGPGAVKSPARRSSWRAPGALPGDKNFAPGSAAANTSANNKPPKLNFGMEDRR